MGRSAIREKSDGWAARRRITEQVGVGADRSRVVSVTQEPETWATDQAVAEKTDRRIAQISIAETPSPTSTFHELMTSLAAYYDALGSRIFDTTTCTSGRVGGSTRTPPSTTE